MLIVRPYQDSDLERIRELHAKQGFDYTAPDWERMLISGVVEEDGEIRMAAFLRKTAEVYLVADPEYGRKRDRLGHLLMLHRELLRPAQRVGFPDCHCWLPPEIDAQFGKLLMHMGWTKALWPSYSFQIEKA